MVKWLLVIAVIYIVYTFFIKKKSLAPNSKTDKTKVDEMVECSKCGVFVDVNEAIVSNGKFYCSDECLKD